MHQKNIKKKHFLKSCISRSPYRLRIHSKLPWGFSFIRLPSLKMAIRFFCVFFICGAVHADFPSAFTTQEREVIPTTEDVHTQLVKLREDVVMRVRKRFGFRNELTVFCFCVCYFFLETFERELSSNCRRRDSTDTAARRDRKTWDRNSRPQENRCQIGRKTRDPSSGKNRAGQTSKSVVSYSSCEILWRAETLQWISPIGNVLDRSRWSRSRRRTHLRRM